MKKLLQHLAVIAILPLCACGSVQQHNYADNQFETLDYMQGIPADAPILQRKGTIFGQMNF